MEENTQNQSALKRFAPLIVLIVVTLAIAGGAVAIVPQFTAPLQTDLIVGNAACLRNSQAQITLRASAQNLGAEEVLEISAVYRKGPVQNVEVGAVSGTPLPSGEKKIITFTASGSEMPKGTYSFELKSSVGYTRVAFVCA